MNLISHIVCIMGSIYFGIYQVVYSEPGKYYPKLKKNLNEFLDEWLNNMIETRYELVERKV